MEMEDQVEESLPDLKKENVMIEVYYAEDDESIGTALGDHCKSNGDVGS